VPIDGLGGAIIMGYGARGLLGASQFYGPWSSRHFLRKWPSQRICNTLVWRKCSF